MVCPQERKQPFSITVLVLFGFFAGAVAWWFYRKERGSISSSLSSLINQYTSRPRGKSSHSDAGAVASDGTEGGHKRFQTRGGERGGKNLGDVET